MCGKTGIKFPVPGIRAIDQVHPTHVMLFVWCLKSRTACADVQAFESQLAGLATPGRGVCIEPFDFNGIGAIDAFTKLIGQKAHKRRVDFANFRYMAVDICKLQVGQQIGYRLLRNIMNLTGQLDIALVVRLNQFLGYFFPEQVKAIVENLPEMTFLFIVQHDNRLGLESRSDASIGRINSQLLDLSQSDLRMCAQYQGRDDFETASGRNSRR
jgi:hypothetical protein